METNTDKSEQVAGNTDKQTAKEREATVEDTEEDESTVEVQSFLLQIWLPLGNMLKIEESPLMPGELFVCDEAIVHGLNGSPWPMPTKLLISP